jgi:hypothetical protein
MFQMSLVLILSSLVHASVLLVPQNYPSIQGAFDASQHADTVLLARGNYFELLQAPEHTVSLFSNYYLTQDTTDLLETVLDGQLEGTILCLQAADTCESVIDGLSFTRGQGDMYTGGAIQLGLNANLTLRNCSFYDNESGTHGADLRCSIVDEEIGDSDISLVNVSLQGCFDAYPPSPNAVQIYTEGGGVC